jgi:hypothetical protein
VEGKAVLEPVRVVAFGIVVARVRAPALGAVERRRRRDLGQVEQAAQLEGLQQVGVEALTLVVIRRAEGSFRGLCQRSGSWAGAEDADIVHHHGRISAQTAPAGLAPGCGASSSAATSACGSGAGARSPLAAEVATFAAAPL